MDTVAAMGPGLSVVQSSPDVPGTVSATSTSIAPTPYVCGRMCENPPLETKQPHDSLISLVGTSSEIVVTVVEWEGQHAKPRG